MRKLVLSTQAALQSLSFDIVATPTIASILGAKPIDQYVQGPTLTTVGGETSLPLSLSGAFLFSGDPVYTDAGRVVNEGYFAMHLADDPTVAPYSPAMVPLTDAVGNVILVNGKELVGFLKVDTSNANATSLELCVDNGNGTFSASALPSGMTGVKYQVIKRFNLNDLPEDALLTKKFFHGVVDVDMMNDLNQLLKDLYGPGYSFNGTGAAALPKSVLEQLQAHLAQTLDAHMANSIGVDTSTGLQPNVQLALQQLQTLISNASSGGTATTNAIQAELDAVEAAVGLNANGTFKAFTGTNYVDSATTTSDAIVKLDTEAKLIADQVAANAAAASAATAAVDAEMEKIELGVYGVDTTDGSMPAITGTNYINSATNLMNADVLLDSAIKAEATRALAAEAAEATRATAAEAAIQAELDRLEAAAGMNADGSFKSYTATNFINGATSMANADVLLDTALQAEITRATAAENLVANNLAAHIASGTAHPANHITVTPSGDLTATDVQGALVELQLDIDALTEALDTASSTLSNQVHNLGTNAGLSHDALGVTYTSHNFIADLSNNGVTGMNHTQAISALDVEAKVLADTIAAETTRATNAENNLQSEINAIENAVGLNSSGAFVPFTGTNYINPATSVVNAEVLLDSALKAEVNRALAAEAAGTAALQAHINSTDAHTASAIDITPISGLTATNVQGALAQLEAQIATEASSAALAAVDAEMEKIELGVYGVETADGAMPAITGTNYINSATSLMNADVLLDAAIKAENTRALAGELAIQTELDNLEAATGMNTDGTFKSYTGTNFINGATSMANADVLLDTALKAEVNRAESAEAALQTSINNETARAEAAEAALQTAINNETSARTSADTTLQNEINALKANGTPVDAEILVYAGGGYVLANAIVPGSKPMLVINGAVQTCGATPADLSNPAVDFVVEDDGTGAVKKIVLASGSGVTSSDSAVIWYRKA